MSYAEQLRREGRREGRQEGRQEGLQEGQKRGEVVGQRRLLRRLLERRFGPLSPELAARVDEADLDRIAVWTDRVLVAPTAEDVLAPVD